MKRRARVALGGSVMLAAGLVSPFALQGVGFFRVRQVELVGVRHVSPDTVLAALKLPAGYTVFHDLDAPGERVAALDGIASARVERRLPGTLRVLVQERVAVAFVPHAGRLVPVDGAGRPLPFDPAATALDLPLIRDHDSLLIGALGLVRVADSALFREVEAARRGTRGSIRLETRQDRLLLPEAAGADEVRALAAVRQHLRADTARRVRELDARYDGWVVVRRSTS